ncbi:hypothetical protein CHS0354_039381 [Potamilus streckersoni]|uniref:Uncharacterized protein n=1 Tax=Potamilus streckersoni TaxID=2493646 RepID=A0AAE0W772_9BIVA|nr:hypothetical protein CHS0354_039381 [Potamilus streckersoni]
MNVSFEHYASFRERPKARRERQPGRRERHCLQSERFIKHTSLTSSITSVASRTELFSKTLPTSTRSHPKFFRSIGQPTQHTTSTPIQDEQVEETIQYKYSEKESLQPKRSELLRQEHLRPQTTTQKFPAWLGDIDVHLDIAPIDVISPFGSVLGAFDSSGNTYNNVPRVGMIYDESDDSCDNDENVCDQFLSDDDEKQRQKTAPQNLSKTSKPAARSLSTKSSRTRLSEKKQTSLTERPFSSRSTERRMSPRTSITSPTITSRTQSPRRYQGDMRVMSMQTGGIRSTPFQPESKKFINQMITYKHMKMHNKKKKMAKPAVDTRMPKTFLMALERKYLVENRLSESWDRSYENSSPVSNDNKSATHSTHSKHKK